LIIDDTPLVREALAGIEEGLEGQTAAR